MRLTDLSCGMLLLSAWLCCCDLAERERVFAAAKTPAIKARTMLNLMVSSNVRSVDSLMTLTEVHAIGILVAFAVSSHGFA